MDGQARGRRRVRIRAVEGDRARPKTDLLAAEEPLEIRVSAGGQTRPVAVTMRTPGQDFELAAGFLFGEGVVASRADFSQIRSCVDPELDGEQRLNVLTVDLRAPALPDLAALDRHVFVSSACGVCGKAGLGSLSGRDPAPLPPGPSVTADVLRGLPATLRAAQGLFEATGGLHAAGLFDVDGTLLALREDIGRHNAVDKLVGWALLEGRLPLRDGVVLVSGRGGYEIVQKCVAAGVPTLCAVSAPSSLAVETARRANQTLVGFLRGDRFNIYSAPGRIALPRAVAALGVHGPPPP